MLGIERMSENTLCLSGELDLVAYDALEAQLNVIIGAVRLDVSAVTFMDSSGLRVILHRLKAGPIVFVSPSAQVLRLLELCGLTNVRGLTIEQGPTSAV